MGRETRPPRRPRQGFSLLEALFGLALIGVALLLTMSLLAQQPGVERRLAAHREALLVLKSELEDLRSHLILPEDGEIDLSDATSPATTRSVESLRNGEVGLPDRTPPPAAQNLRVWVDFDKRPERSLYEVELLARYSVGSKTYEMKLRSMVFSP